MQPDAVKAGKGQWAKRRGGGGGGGGVEIDKKSSGESWGILAPQKNLER
jgi:hypothetical protein